MARYRSPRINQSNQQRNVVNTLLIGLVLGLAGVLFLVLINLEPTPPTLPISAAINPANLEEAAHIPAYDPTLAALNIYPSSLTNSERELEPALTPIPTPALIATQLPATESEHKPASGSITETSSTIDLRDEFNPRSQQHYERALELATETHASQSQDYFQWVHLITQSINIHHGTQVSERLKAAFNGQNIRNAECLWLLAKLLGPNLPSPPSPTSMEACSDQDREEFLRILAIRSVQPSTPSLWRSFSQQALGRFRLNNATKVKSLAAIILVTNQFREAMSPEQQTLLVDQIPEGELIEAFQQVAGLESNLSQRFVDLIEKNKLVPFPKNLFLRPFRVESELFPELRRTLANSLGSRIDTKLVDLSELISPTVSGEILLAICASSADPQLLNRVFDALANRTTPRPARDFIKILKTSRTDIRTRVLPAVCLSPFYSELPDQKKKQVVKKFNELINDDKFVQNVIDSDSTELIRDFTLAYGQNFSLHILKRLEKYPDAEIREAARKYLEWYRG
jgi:hypothetical protein